MRKLVILCCLFPAAAAARAGDASKPAKLTLNPAIVKAAPDKWLRLHEQKAGDKVRFRLQAHGGSCFDSKRGRIVLFGSNTHGRDWTNSPLFFDVAKGEWSRAYANDKKETYKANAKGLPVAGEKGDRPWATHTFGAVMYDARRDEMVVACYPGHMIPGRFTRALTPTLWNKAKGHHPTWTYRFAEKKWVPLACKAMHFFPNSAAYDSHRGTIIGHKPGSIFELAGTPREWKRTASGKEIPGWGHDNCAYDAKHRKLVVFGGNKNSNDVAVYDPAAKTLKLMPAKGPRPPADQHTPMEFVPGLGQTVVLVDRTARKDKADKDTTETWCYDLGKDSWRQIKSATLPFACGMNFNMEYDPGHKVLLLVASAPGKFGRATTVFALKVSPPKK